MNNKGFSLAEVVVAAGLLGVVSLGVMRLVDNMMKSQKTFETQSEVTLVTNGIAQTLTNEKACENTFTGINLAANTSVGSIQNSNAADVFVVGSQYGNRKVILTGLDVENISLASDGTSKVGTFDLVIGIQKTSNVAQGAQNLRKVVTLSVVTDLADNFVGCFNSAAGATKNSCENIGGTFNSASQSCDLVPYPGIAAIPNDAAAQQQAVSQRYIDGLITDLDARYLFKGTESLAASPTVNTTVIGDSATTDNITLNARMTVSGNSTFTGTALFNEHITVANGKYIAMQSDKRLKRNIHPLENVLKDLEKLSGVRFKWKADDRRDIGVLAQDLEKVYPSLVVKNRTSGVLLVKYPQLTAVAIQAVKELHEENKILRKRVDEMQQAICEISPNSKICIK
ncbi:tail fiber domain-containing protein [Halobacteriovorax sp. HLS]|uniref:tail fiber domain-containing protein n=1 Tax=Halobacteriovorax sp. HLS TaxID=2234000 RepID=UPI000FD7555C|nr:tail fiber domain-containing protein [Halobacteriovorax sp. HLS]